MTKWYNINWGMAKMGRPKLKAGEKRALFTIRFSRDEVKSYEKAAGTNKMILRKWMRKVLNEAARTGGGTTDT